MQFNIDINLIYTLTNYTPVIGATSRLNLVDFYDRLFK